MQRTYPLLYNCPRKQRPRGESGPFSPVSRNPEYRSCFQRLSPTRSRTEQHLKHRNKCLTWELLECLVFGTREKFTQFHPGKHTVYENNRERSFAVSEFPPPGHAASKPKDSFSSSVPVIPWTHQSTEYCSAIWEPPESCPGALPPAHEAAPLPSPCQLPKNTSKL